MARDYVMHSFPSEVNLSIDYARELNPQQHAAVTAPPGPSLVIAGAGSGKTRALTYRVAFLLENGVPPDRILLLTFTNKAAGEMMRRVAELIGREQPMLWGGTFHAIGNRVLRLHADRLGYPRSFTIMDRDDAEDLMKASLEEAGHTTKGGQFPKADILLEVHSLAVNTLKTIEEIVRQEHPHFEHLTAKMAGVLTLYTERKLRAALMDFDDLQALWLHLLRSHEDLRDLYQRRFQFILVDEYQDTNKLQGELVDLLGARHHNIMVVGDDAQSIYAWRGANYRNIMDFPRRHPNTQVYKIETNYRSTPEILTLANAAIAANTSQFAKELVPARRNGPLPALVTCQESFQQAAFVAQRALELSQEGVPLDQMAVLYRSHSHAMEIQMELTRQQVPFTITSGIRFFEQAHVKDVASYLRLVANPRDETSFKRLVRMLPGIGAKGADKLWALYLAEVSNGPRRPEEPAPADATPPPDRLQLSPPADPADASGEDGPWSAQAPPAPAREAPDGGAPAPGRIAPALRAARARVPAKAVSAWERWAALMEQLEDPLLHRDPAKMVQSALEGGYEEYLRATFANYRARLEDLEQLASFASGFNALDLFLAQLALLTSVEAEEERAAKSQDHKLRLTTIHQAKGLEYSVVFVVMLCEGAFPSKRALMDEEDIEEERRLFYVAVTRAKDALYLCHPILRRTYEAGLVPQQPSRFLQEIPRPLMEAWNLLSY